MPATNFSMPGLSFAAATPSPMTPFPAATGTQSLNSYDDPSSIINLLNQINLGAQQAANAARIPNALGLEGQSSNAISDALRGRVPDDVIALLQQNSAESGAGRGMYPGSPSTNAQFSRALGRTSLDLIGAGQNWLSQALGRNPPAPVVNPADFVLTPAQKEQLAIQRERLAQEKAMQEAQLALERERLAQQLALERRRLSQSRLPTGSLSANPMTRNPFTYTPPRGSLTSPGNWAGPALPSSPSLPSLDFSSLLGPSTLGVGDMFPAESFSTLPTDTGFSNSLFSESPGVSYDYAPVIPPFDFLGENLFPEPPAISY